MSNECLTIVYISLFPMMRTITKFRLVLIAHRRNCTMPKWWVFCDDTLILKPLYKLRVRCFVYMLRALVLENLLYVSIHLYMIWLGTEDGDMVGLPLSQISRLSECELPACGRIICWLLNSNEDWPLIGCQEDCPHIWLGSDMLLPVENNYMIFIFFTSLEAN